MRRFFTFLIVTTMLLSVGCSTDYDDREVWNSINSLEQRLSTMETVMNAYKNKLSIDSLTPIENGYRITFSDGSQATIINGKDGENGKDGKDGDTYIDNITVGENEVTFILTDGSTFSIPLQSALTIDFDANDLIAMIAGQERHIQFSITSPNNDVEIEVISSADIKSSFQWTDKSKKEGYIKISTTSEPDPEYSKVIVFVTNGYKVIMKRFYFTDNGIDVYDNSQKKADSEGGELELEFISSVDYQISIPQEVSNWISIAPDNSTRSNLSKQSVFIQLANNEGEAREAVVTISCPYDQAMSVDFNIVQKANWEYTQKGDKEALIDIYHALGGEDPDYFRWYGWGTDAPLEFWFGVTIDDISGRVIELNLEECEGAIPPSIGNLTVLKKLVLDQSTITSLPAEIGLLSELEHLEIRGKYGNGISLSIPNEIENLTALRHLSLSFNNITTLPKSFYNLKNLEYLDLGFNHNLTGNIFDELTTNLTNLKHLDLYLDYNVTGSINNISNLTMLESLSISCTQVDGTIPSDIGNLKNLENFGAFSTDISGSLPASMALLKNLKAISLDMTNISGDFPEWIGELTNLEHIDFTSTQISGEIPESISNLKKLKVLSLLYDNITGTIPATLGDITTLETLQLAGCKLTGPIPENLADVPSLWLYDNNLTGDIPTKMLYSDNWRNHWGWIVVGNNLNIDGLTFPGPNFTMDVDQLDDRKFNIADEYSKNKFTILFQWSANCIFLNDTVELLKRIHNKYHNNGLKVIGRTFMESSSMNLITEYAMPWETYYNQQLDYPAFIAPTITVIDNSGMVIFSDVIQDRDELETFIDNQYNK